MSWILFLTCCVQGLIVLVLLSFAVVILRHAFRQPLRAAEEVEMLQHLLDRERETTRRLREGKGGQS